ncbi:hypothetical protein CR513_02944, partial [Mucuna pruriens]
MMFGILFVIYSVAKLVEIFLIPKLDHSKHISRTSNPLVYAILPLQDGTTNNTILAQEIIHHMHRFKAKNE